MLQISRLKKRFSRHAATSDHESAANLYWHISSKNESPFSVYIIRDHPHLSFRLKLLFIASTLYRLDQLKIIPI